MEFVPHDFVRFAVDSGVLVFLAESADPLQGLQFDLFPLFGAVSGLGFEQADDVPAKVISGAPLRPNGIRAKGADTRKLDTFRSSIKALIA